MVVMPFDTFEELNEVYRASPDAWDEGEVGIEYSELEPGPDDRFETPPESYNSEVLNELQGQENTASKGDSYASEGASDDVSHLSMEERFYLEPVDDDQ